MPPPNEINPKRCCRKGAEYRNHPAFEQEDARYKPVIGTQVAQCLHVLPFVQYQHGQRTDDIEACDTQNEGEEEIRDEFLYFHDAENIGLLLVAVLYNEPVAENACYFLLYGADVGTGFQFHLDGRDFRVIIKQTAGKVE